MKLTLLLASFAMTIGAPCFGQGSVTNGTLTVDIVDAADGVTLPPAGVAAFDVFMNAGPMDVWTASGLVCMAQNGATFRYALVPDDDDPGLLILRLINPTTANRFTCFLSKPRARDVTSRYTNGAAAVAGRYSPTGPSATSTSTEFNVVWFASPPETSSSPSVDGYIARVAINLPAGITASQIQLGMTAPANALVLVRSVGDGSSMGLVTATFDIPTTAGFNWFAYVPCAASITQQPAARTVCRGGDAVFRVTAAGTPPLTYQWRRNLTNLANGGQIAGATGATLVISDAVAANAGTYSCVVTGAGGCTATTSNAALTVNNNCCGPADVAGLGGTPGPNGTLTADDLVFYLSRFFAGTLSVADLVTVGGLAIPDGVLSPDDLVRFLSEFFEGC